jgi:hypothetical protein
MQVSATLIAAQAAAREARARLQIPGQEAASKAGFTAALEKAAGAQDGFSALPLRQVTAAPAAPQQQAASPGRLGQHVNILV